MKKIQGLLTIVFGWALSAIAFAQRPTHVPYDSEPIRFIESWENIVFFILLPVLIIILYIIWRRRLRKEENKKER